jgi:hypothetical protein
MPPPTRRGTPLPIVEEKGWTSSMALKPTIYSPIGKDRIQNSTLVQRTEKGDRKARNPYESTKCKSKRGDPSSVVDEEISPDVADRHSIHVPGPFHHSLEPTIAGGPCVSAEVSIEEDGTRNSTLVQRTEKSARKGARKPYESSKRKSTRRQMSCADSESQDVIYAPSHGDSLELPEDDQKDPTHIGQTSTTALQWVEPPRSLPLVQRTKKSRIRKRASSKPYGSKQSKAEFESKNIVYAKAAERRRELDDMEAVSAFSTIHARCATTGVGIKLDDRNKSDKGYNSGFIVKHLGKCAAMKNKVRDHAFVVVPS